MKVNHQCFSFRSWRYKELRDADHFRGRAVIRCGSLKEMCSLFLGQIFSPASLCNRCFFKTSPYIYIYIGLQLEISNFIEVKNKLKIKDTDLNILHDKISYIEVCTFFSFNLFLTLI